MLLKQFRYSKVLAPIVQQCWVDIIQLVVSWFESVLLCCSGRNKSGISRLFFEDGTFCRLLMAFPLKMYSKFGRPKQILVGQMLKLVRKWPMASCHFRTVLLHAKWLALKSVWLHEIDAKVGHTIQHETLAVENIGESH